MELIATNSLNKKQKREIILLWNNEYPANLRHQNLESFEKYLSPLESQEHIIIVDNSKTIKGWYLDFERKNEKWFAMVLDSKLKRKGLGTQLLNKGKEKNSELNGWVIDHNKELKQNKEYYISAIEFYLKNDFRV